jgi:hypothetical protein
VIVSDLEVKRTLMFKLRTAAMWHFKWPNHPNLAIIKIFCKIINASEFYRALLNQGENNLITSFSNIMRRRKTFNMI